MKQEQTYPDVKMFIDGAWCDGSQGRSGAVLNPATGLAIGSVPHASVDDLDRALDSAWRGFNAWRKTSAFDRYKLMRAAAEKLRERAGEIARILTLEQGKPLAEANLEVLLGADIVDWFAEEAPRTHR
ncbi:MAG TPA: NAD-dependent succinate-semialdehyde dehydrogenase, partial [Afipia sp.]|nr:NAD-dependent succinate-semialdehyde dehydrogenase [Afipia sp.]